MRRLVIAAAFAAACHGPRPALPVAAAEPASADVRALFAEALALRQKGDDAGARAKLDRVLAADPTFALAALERAQVLVALGHARDAAPDARLAVAALPRNPRAWHVLGEVLEDGGQLAGAIEAYRKSAAIRDDPKVARKLAALDGRAGDFARAAREWEALREASPGDVAIHLELAGLYDKLDRPASAEAEYRSTIRLVPDNALFHRRFAAFLTTQGKTGEARREEAKAEALAPKPPPGRELRPLLPSRR